MEPLINSTHSARPPMIPAPADDVEDSPAAFAQFPHLQHVLSESSRILCDVYRRADADALRHQRQHHLLSRIAVVCGTAAVLFAILQLANLFPIPWLKQMELIAALAAVTAVALGLIAARRSRWLLHRHRAERCRLLKYRFLIDPALWGRDSERKSRYDQLDSEAHALATMSPADLHHWSENDEMPQLPGGSDCAAVPAAVRRELSDYYRSTRLQSQVDYFTRRVKRDQRADRPTRHLPAICFFLSVLATLGHFVHDLATPHSGPDTVSIILITLAAAFPVLGSGVNTLRMAHEHSRNTARFRAKLVVLIRLSEILARENDSESLFRELWVGEQVLESEHREWLRLMLDAEWFG